ncbi:hypothetical protein Tco_0669415 [Tanacetum coccineum]
MNIKRCSSRRFIREHKDCWTIRVIRGGGVVRVLNEYPRPLFIAFPTLRGQEILVIRLGHTGDDVESLGAVLERLWCKVTHPVMPEDTPEPAQEGAVEVTYDTLGDLVQRFHDHTQAILVHRIQVIEGVQREQGRRIVGVKSVVTALNERIAKLERDNRRLKGTTSVESQRVDRLQRGMSRMRRELRQI